MGIIVLSIIAGLVTLGALWVASNDAKASGNKDSGRKHVV